MEILKVLQKLECPDKRRSEVLLKALKDPSWEVRRTAAVLLTSFKYKPEETVPLLIEALEDENVHVRSSVMNAVYARGTAARDAAPILKTMLDDPDTFIAAGALEVLTSVYTDREEMIPILMQAVRSEKAMLRNNALRGFMKLGYFHVDLVPILMKYIDHPHGTTRYLAIQLLASLGEDAEPALWRLIFLLEGGGKWCWDINPEIVRAMGNIGVVNDKVREALINSLDDPCPKVEKEARRAMKKLGIRIPEDEE
jgi:HEAT repeat protein